MRLAVALVDRGGRPLGPCVNPQPLWTLLRSGLPAAEGACPFALTPIVPCTCVADALAHGETDILTYRQFVKVVRLQRRLARTDPGGNIVL